MCNGWLEVNIISEDESITRGLIRKERIEAVYVIEDVTTIMVRDEKGDVSAMSVTEDFWTVRFALVDD